MVNFVSPLVMIKGPTVGKFIYFYFIIEGISLTVGEKQFPHVSIQEKSCINMTQKEIKKKKESKS